MNGRAKRTTGLRKNKDFCVDLDFIFYIYSTSMFNILMYFKENNISDEEQRYTMKRKILY